MTELVATASELRELVAAGKINLSELMDRLAEENEKAQEPQPERPHPTTVVLSPEDKKALRTLPAQLADLALPAEARALSQAERDALVPLFDQIKVAKAAVEKAESALKEALHCDIDANTTGEEYDDNGHRLTKGEVVATEYAKKVIRTVNGGKAVELTDTDLKLLEERGAITHAAYLRMTKAVNARTVVPEAVMVEINKDPSLIDAFAQVARKTKRTLSLRMSKRAG